MKTDLRIGKLTAPAQMHFTGVVAQVSDAHIAKQRFHLHHALQKAFNVTGGLCQVGRETKHMLGRLDPQLQSAQRMSQFP